MIGLSVDSKADVARFLSVGPEEIDEVVSHIRSFYRPMQRLKPNGSKRTLHVPAGPLKLLQEKIKNRILDATGLLECVHGGVRHRSVVTNALPHVRKEVVFTLDLKDFFPSVNWATVRAIFRTLGFGEEAATLLTKLVVWESHLLQGAPTSTGVANLAMLRVDMRLHQAPLITRHLLRYQAWFSTRLRGGATSDVPSGNTHRRERQTWSGDAALRR